MLSDIAMLSVPIYLIWRLQISRRRKIGISAIFLTGGLYVARFPTAPFHTHLQISQRMHLQHPASSIHIPPRQH